MSNLIYACLCTFFSVSPVFCSIAVRDCVKRHRQSIIRDLAAFFGHRKSEGKANTKKEEESDDDLLRSFEFVKFKYFLAAETAAQSETRRAIIQGLHLTDARLAEKSMISPDDFKVSEWVLLSLPLIILLMLLSYAALAIILALSGQPTGSLVPQYLTKLFVSHRTFALTLQATLLGAYTYMIRAFFQAINNFDLTPASFLGAANNIIFGVVFTQVATFYLSKGAEGVTIATGARIVTAFVGGYMPDNILQYLLQTSLVKFFKAERSDFGDNGKAVPLEVLDGVDSQIRYRLSDFHITAVQNLAAANPIMLFVETPYGIYQMLDWVAQAQLCVSVGPEALFRLWKLGIRTIFDLERLALSEGFKNEQLLRAIEAILLPGVQTPDPWDDKAIVCSIRTRVDSKYTHRLRQIVMRVTDQLGGDKTRYL